MSACGSGSNFLSWILGDAPLPFESCYRNVVTVLHIACFPNSELHLNKAHLRRIVLSAVVAFLVTDWDAQLEGVLVSTQAYLEECWRGWFPFVAFKEVLLDIYAFFTRVCI